MNLLKGKKILIFDTETTGLPDRIGWDKYYDYRQTKHYENARLIEISWYYSDCFLGNYNENDISTHLVKPKFKQVKWPPFDDKHQISYEEACQGCHLSEIMTKHGFRAHLYNTDYLVGHNLKFDYQILSSELSRIKGSNKILEKLDYLMVQNKYFDTQQYGEKLCKLPCSNPYHYKTPSLKELYFHLYEKYPQRSHRAKDDVITVLECIKNL